MVDVRERKELELASIKKYAEIVWLPLSDFTSWEANISNKLDDAKTTYCLVSVLIIDKTVEVILIRECCYFTVSSWCTKHESG